MKEFDFIREQLEKQYQNLNFDSYGKNNNA